MFNVSKGATLLMSAVLTAPASATFSFQALGDLPGGATNSLAYGVSRNGQWVVGESTSTNGVEAFRWSSATGMLAMGDLAGGAFTSRAFDASEDGSVIVGHANGTQGQQAFRWTAASGMVGLGDLAGGNFDSNAFSVSADGGTVVGQSHATGGYRAFRWTSATGLVNLGVLPGNTGSNALGVSADGSVVLGHCGANSTGTAYKWTQATGMVSFGDLPGGAQLGTCFDITDDKSVIIGSGADAAGEKFCRWTNDANLTALGDLAGGTTQSRPSGVSADGAVIVGFGNDASGQRAVVWHQSFGMKDLKTWLIEKGVTGLANWTLQNASGVSADGTTIIGYGINPSGQTEAWVAKIEVPESKGAVFMAQTPPPATIVSGTKANVSITMRNVGTTTWTPAGKYYLGSRTPLDNTFWGARRIPMAAGESAPPGTNYTFNYAVTAPWEPGTYNFQWKSLNATGWFGDMTPLVAITVTRAANAGVFVSQTGIPATIARNGTFTASITMKNTGTATWTTATGFKLGSWNPTNNTVWGTSRWDMPAGSSIPTDGQVTFTRTFTAPATPGTYVFQWRMIKSGVAFFGTTSTAVTVTVT